MSTVEHPGARGRLRWRNIALHVLTIALYLVLAAWAADFSLAEPPVPLIWPATGVGLAMVYRFGYPLAASVFIGALAAQLLLGMSWFEASVLATGNTLGVLAGTAVLRRLRFRQQLERSSDLLRLLLTGISVTAIPGALFGTLIAVGTSPAFPKTLGLCWLADAMGVLLFAPLLLTVRNPLRDPLARQHHYLLAALLMIGALTVVVHSGLLADMVAMPLSYAIYPAVLLVAFVYPVWVVAATVVLVSVTAISLTGMERGPFAYADMQQNLLALQAHLALLAVTSHVVAAVRHEREAAEARARNHMRSLAGVHRLNAVNTMAASLAHEINQPLCAVSSYAQAGARLLERYPPADGQAASRLQEAMQGITTGTERASAIVGRARQLLSRGDEQRQSQSLNTLVRQTASMLGGEFRRQGVRVQTHLDPDLPEISLDALEMQQVLSNLLHNALTAVTAQEDQRRWINIATRAEGRPAKAAWLTISDGGEGLPPGERHLLFEPLVSGRADGTGLGLAVARSIVEAHGGTIRAGDAPGGGAAFEICLPV